MGREGGWAAFGIGDEGEGGGVKDAGGEGLEVD